MGVHSRIRQKRQGNQGIQACSADVPARPETGRGPRDSRLYDWQDVESAPSRTAEAGHEEFNAPHAAILLDSYEEAAGGEDVLRVEGGFEAAHQGEIGAWRSPNVGTVLAGWWNKEKRSTATRSGNHIKDLRDASRESHSSVFVRNGGEQGEIDDAACAGHERMGKGGTIGDLAQACEQGGMMTGKNADLENGRRGRGFKEHGEAFAEASPKGGARGVFQGHCAGGAGVGCKAREVALVTREDFGGAGEGGAELPLARTKPIADGREETLVRGLFFSGENCCFGSLRRLLGKELG